MPIYAYRCDACGHAKDVLQKLSDPVLETCPACGQNAYRKQVTAAGFQLKGSGWYVTDFRGGNGAAKSDGTPDAAKPDAAKGGDAPKTESTPAAAVPAASTGSSGDGGTASGGCGASCACH